MIKNLKLSTKILYAFGVVVLLTLLLGGLAVSNMRSSAQTAARFSQDQLPEVGAANDVERWGLRTMYEARGYFYSEQKALHEATLANLTKLKDSVRAAAEHAELHNMVDLRKSAKLAGEKTAAYEKLILDIATATESLAVDRSRLNATGGDYMKASYAFLESQQKKLDGELEELAKGKLKTAAVRERILKTVVVNDVIDLGNAVRLGAWKAMAAREPEHLTEVSKKFSDIKAKLAELKTITRQPADQKAIADCEAAGEAYHETLNAFQTHWVEREELGQKRNTIAAEIRGLAEAAAKNGMDDAASAARTAISALSSSSNMILAGCAVCVLLGLGMGWLVARGISGPILSVAEAISSGTTQTAAAANQVAASSQTLADGSSQQAAALEETSSSLEQMSGMTKRNAASAQAAKDLAQQARHAADLGATDMQAMTEAMGEINSASQEIAKIIKTIDEIAFQTNILALNAAVEAARAGEAGMGFAVVADEVRSLAHRAAVAAKETAEKIEGAAGKTASGVQLSGKVATTLKEIVAKARQVDTLVAEVATASRDQMQGIGQLNTAIGQIDKVTQDNAASAEESASAAEEMNAQTESLNEAVSVLLQLVNGSTGVAKPKGDAFAATLKPTLRTATAGDASPYSTSVSRQIAVRVEAHETFKDHEVKLVTDVVR